MNNHFFSSLSTADSNISPALRHANQCYERMHTLLYSNYYDGLAIEHAYKARADWHDAKALLVGPDLGAHYASLESILDRARAPYLAREKSRAIAYASAINSARAKHDRDNWDYEGVPLAEWDT